MATTENQTSKQVVEDFLKTFSTGDVEHILASMTEDATWWVAGTMEGISGTYTREEFGQLAGGIGAGTKEARIQLTPHAWTVDGDRVAVETESYAELNNGRVYNNHYHFLFVVQDGRIHRVKEYLDTEHTSAIFLKP
ncbi:nuclear transport factor 2 family protein [Patulibacter minatonensis]|uniref:nuclear transport factor 2 family protein n=1 Tax=Patulibacter minatonensis TaxID=298163 RepID=UPI00047D1BAF|nr:nuclear transport factor 2 family protein [Patulibacter minatonensis]